MYETAAARYDEDRARFSIPRDEVIDELLATLDRVRVLDLGCGTGRWLAAQRDAFADASVTLLGADPSAAMLAEARAKGIGGLTRARAEDLPWRDATLDLVSSGYAFHHFGDKDQAVGEIARVLAPGGRFRLTNIEPTGAVRWWIYEHFPEAVAIDTARFWTPERTADALERRGLEVEVRLETGGEEIPAAQALADAERRVVSELALLDDASYEHGLARLRQVAQDPAATVTETRSRLHLTARR